MLQKKNVAHQDLKPSNILIDKDGNWVISDFTVSIDLRQQNTYVFV